MSAVTRRTGMGTGTVTALGVLIVLAVGFVFCWTIAEWLNTGVATVVSPIDAIIDGIPWTPSHTLVMVLAGFVAAVVIAGAIVAAVRSDRAKEDSAAVHMGRGKQIAPLLPSEVAKTHKRMGWDPRECRGVHLGYTVAGNLPLRASFETTGTMIAGPGRNKTTAMVIPNILDAPGTVITTSVRPDVFEATAGYRSTVGRIHVFDPQGNAPMAADYGVWWNALRGIQTPDDAEDLAAVLAAYYVDEGGENKFFEQEGSRLVADYIFAASLAPGEYLPVVQRWLKRDDSTAPARILREQYPAIAARIENAQAVTERTRSGIFAYARGAVAFLADERLAAWVQPGEGRRELSPTDLVAAPRDTLYLFSKEGRGSAGPLVSALMKTLLDTAERVSEKSPGARLPMPLLVPIDEAGNICRIPDLPDRYSHYRDRGIVVITILQSEDQGKQVWPNGGFEKLIAASMWWVFAGGNASAGFYRNLSDLIGDYEFVDRSTNSGRGGGSVQVNKRSEKIMDVSDLGALTMGRWVVFASGCRPTLVRARPWFKDKRMRKLVAMRPERVHRVAEVSQDA
jgi:type IV secretory pathway TraG/TraD family ATPase VirD4